MTEIDNALNVAVHLQNEGKLAQAETVLNTILAEDPTNAYALHLLGIITYQVGKISLGIQLVQRAIESNSTEALFFSNLGEMHRKAKALDLSIQCGQRAIELDPDSAFALSNLGIAYYDLKQYEKAEECHKRALKIHPTLACSLNNMGSIYKEYGETKKACSFYQAAIEASSHFAEPINNLGLIFLHEQEFIQALEYFNRAIQLAPTFVEGHCNLGAVFLGLEQYDKALFYFEKTVQAKPDHAEAYYGLAKVYLHKKDFIESERNARKALAINADQSVFYGHLATICNERGDPHQALLYLNQALAINPTLTSLHVSKGATLMEMGEIPQAEAQFLNLTQQSQVEAHIFAHYNLVQIRKIKSDNISLKELLSIADHAQEVPSHKLEYVYFALGKCFDDLGEWSKSFEYFTQGCQLKRKRIFYDSAEQVQFTHRLIQCFSKERIEYLQKFANPSALPIFIVGMPRSGSTLVEQILSNHSQVYGGGEVTYLHDLIKMPVENNNTIFSYPENILKLSPIAYEGLTNKYLLSLQSISPKAPRITDKMLYNFIAIGLIHALFPNAKIIHVKRNPIDICLSCYMKLFTQGHFYSYDLTELGQYYNCYERIMHHWRQTLPPNAWIDVEYENMINNLESETQRLFAFCNLNWEPASLDFYQSSRQVRTASLIQVRQPIYTSSVERWRRFERDLAPLINTLKVANLSPNSIHDQRLAVR